MSDDAKFIYCYGIKCNIIGKQFKDPYFFAQIKKLHQDKDLDKIIFYKGFLDRRFLNDLSKRGEI